MLNIFTISPYIAGIGIAIFHTFILLGKIWSSDRNNSSKIAGDRQFNFIQELFRQLFFLFGVIFINISVFWLAGQWSYVDWPFQLPNVILGIFVGIQYIIKSQFLKPKKIDVIFAILFAIFIFISINLLIIGPSNLQDDLVLILILNNVVIIVFIFIRKQLEAKGRTGEYLWDITDKYKKIFNTPVIIITWIIASINVMLNFSGASIFAW